MQAWLGVIGVIGVIGLRLAMISTTRPASGRRDRGGE
jgi:hypothetical protein